MDRQQLLKRLDNGWRDFQDSYAGLPDSLLMERGVTGDWSIRDIVAHVTTWEEEALKHLPFIIDGKKPPKYSVAYGGIKAFNAYKTEEKKNLSLSQVLRQQEDTHRRLVEFIESTSEDQFSGATRYRHRLRLDTYSHYPKHAAAIRKWREQRVPAR